jgi:hypothetical protein
MNATASPIRFAGSQLGQNRHVCAFFNSSDESYRVLMPFIKDGFECGDKALHVVNPEDRSAHLQRLAIAGIDTDVTEETGQLDVRTSPDVYLVDGHFDQDRMIGVFEELASGNGTFPLSRIVCQMDWASKDQSHIDDVVEFEARVNDVWCKHDDAVICVYDLSKIGGDMVVDIMRTHPMIIIGGLLQENPFYIPPAQFLEERRKRRAAVENSSEP